MEFSRHVIARPSVSARRDAGFTLVEVLVATALVSGALAGVVQLVALSGRANLSSRDVLYSVLLSSQKASEIAGEDLLDVPISAPDAWLRTAGSDVEFLGADGSVLTRGGTPPGNALYVRRWSATPLPGDGNGGLVVQVAAARLRRQSDGSAADAVATQTVRMVMARTRMVP